MGKWYEEAVFYHMYPIGMSGAPRRNEQEKITHRFPMLESWLPHIAQLGCTAIYIGPLFESTSHGYDTKDYKLVDKRLGDNVDFCRFVKKAHDLNLKVVESNLVISDQPAPKYSISHFLPYLVLLIGGVLILCFMKR